MTCYRLRVKITRSGCLTDNLNCCNLERAYAGGLSQWPFRHSVVTGNEEC
jgi:hypothetical protein